MINWRGKLDIFLSNFEHMKDVDGILVCGSYITGNPSSHSDLDVHIVLNNSVDFREKGNKIIDGLMIEYFANPPKQILKYFDGDFNDKSLMSQVQFATGEIIVDKNHTVTSLKEKAKNMIDDFYKTEGTTISDSTKCFFWDMLDDLQDAYENNRPDFDFLYFNLLNRLMSNYMNCINRPYVFKAIYGNITNPIVRKKYLLKELPDVAISDLMAKCIIAVDKSEKMRLYQALTDEITNKFGGFDINDYKMKSKVSI